MSRGDDDLFARWSRRKLAARSDEARRPDEAAHAADAPPSEAATEPPTGADADRALPAAAPAAEPPEPVPSLEDLTADGDLSAFLRKGVPTALKNAAMRKMWSLDPAIRDHVGLAENSWDFNQPGSMPGFGPLRAGKAVADFLSTANGAVPAESEEPQPPAPPRPTVASEQASAAPPDELAQAPVMPDDPRPALEVAAAPEAAEAADSVESDPAPRPRHGGALPR